MSRKKKRPASTPRPTAPPQPASPHDPDEEQYQLSGFQMAVCILLPLIGLVMGVFRFMNRRPLARPLLLTSGVCAVIHAVLTYLLVSGTFSYDKSKELTPIVEKRAKDRR